MEKKKPTRVNMVRAVLFLGIVLACLALIGYLAGHAFLKKKLEDGRILRKDSETVGNWAESEAIVLRKYYFFDIKNQRNVLSGTEKPRLVERGPYVYREYKRNINIQFIGDNMISYQPTNTLVFEPSLSVGNESDMITFLNIPAAAMIDKAIKEGKNYKGNSINFGFLALNGVLDYLQVKLFLTKTIGQLVNGYTDQLLEFGQSIMPGTVKTDKFSILNGENNTVKENFTILNGADGIDSYGKVVEWNGLKKLNYWDSDKANTIDGDDSACFKPLKTRTEPLKLFTSALGRTLILSYNKDMHIDGFDTYKFGLKKDLFYNASVNPENAGYGYEYPGNGVHNVGRLNSDAPTYLSLPHFLKADRKFVNDVEGLEPQELKHDFTFHIEPITGVPIKGNGRMQLNVMIQGNKNIFLAQKIKTVLLPVFWAEVTFEHDPSTLVLLSKVVSIYNLLTLVPFVLFCIGSCLVLLASVALIISHFAQEAKVKGGDKNHKKNVKYTSVVNANVKNNPNNKV